MLVRTTTSQRTMSLLVCFACRAVGVKAESVFSSQKVAEVEAVLGLGGLFELLIECCWGLHLRHDGCWLRKQTTLRAL